MDQLLMRRSTLDSLPPIPPLPPGYTLREYQDGDLEPVARLLSAAFNDENWTPDQVRRKLVDAPDVRKTFVVAYEGAPVAVASVRLLPDRFPDSGYLHWVAVDPAHQGRKLGAVVVLAVLHEFARIGCKDAVLETDDDRLPAIKTYQNLGFRPEHREPMHVDRWAKIASDLLAAVNL
jgi:mycothiol synthase